MGWGSFDDQMPMNPKVVALSDGAFRLWMNILAYCNRNATKGVIPKALVPSCDHRHGWSKKQIDGFVRELLTVQPTYEEALLLDEGAVYRAHDYEAHQQYATKQGDIRAYERERKAKNRASKKSGTTTSDVPDIVPDIDGDLSGTNSGTVPVDVPSVSLARERSRDPEPQPNQSTSCSGAREEDRTDERPARPTAVSRFEAAARGPAATPSDRLSRADVARMFSELRVEAKRGSWRSQGYHDEERLDDLAAWANAEGADRAARETALVGAIRAFVADTSERVVGARWALAFFRDPGAYLAAHLAKPSLTLPASPALAKAQRAYDAAHAECRAAREAKDALAGRDGYGEASKRHAKARDALALAGDELERAIRESAA